MRPFLVQLCVLKDDTLALVQNIEALNIIFAFINVRSYRRIPTLQIHDIPGELIVEQLEVLLLLFVLLSITIDGLHIVIIHR